MSGNKKNQETKTRGSEELTERMRKLEGTLSHGHSIGLCKFQARKDHNLEIYKTRSVIKLGSLRDQESNKQRTALETYPEKKLYAIRRN